MTDATPATPATEDNERNAYRWALRVTAAGGAVFAAGAAAVGWFAAGASGAWGALAGAVIAVGSALATQAAMVAAQRRSPEQFAAIVGGAWLGKMVVIVVGLMVLAGLDAVHRPALAVATVVGVAATLAVDLIAVRRSRVPYVRPV